jgi:hypothetical protein
MERKAMDDLDRQFAYPRYLTVPFIFVPDGNEGGPELAQFKRDYPGWVTFRATFTPTPQPVLESESAMVQRQALGPTEWAEPEPWAEAEAPAPEVPPAATDRRPERIRKVVPPPEPPPPLGRLPGGRSTSVEAGARNLGMDLWTTAGTREAVRAAMAHIDAHQGDVAAALASAKAWRPSPAVFNPPPAPPLSHAGDVSDALRKRDVDVSMSGVTREELASLPQHSPEVADAVGAGLDATAARPGPRVVMSTPTLSAAHPAKEPLDPSDLGKSSLSGIDDRADGIADVQLASFNYVLSPPSESFLDPNIIPAAGTDKKLEPDQNAAGPHSTFRRSSDGSIHNYETYDYNPKTGKYERLLRYRGVGKKHDKVPTPYVMERREGKGLGSPPKDARPALPHEVPGTPKAAPEPPKLELPKDDIPDILEL